jgi:hypothetical protein
VGVGLGDGDGEGDGLGLGDGEGLGLGDGLGLGEGLGDGDGLGDGEGLGLGEGDGLEPVVGCHDGFMSEPAEDANDVAAPVDGFSTRRSSAPVPGSVASTIRVPSGDHDGVYRFVEGEYTGTAPEPFAFDVYTWV